MSLKFGTSICCLAVVSLLFVFVATPVHGEPVITKATSGYSSPLKQYKAGVSLNDIQCTQGLQLVIKSKDASPACVKPATASRLISLGWAKPVADEQSTTKTVTLDDNNKSVTIRKGQSFLLKLGEAYNWDINIDDQSVLSRVMNVMVIKGAQGLYVGHNTGHTTLVATGDPWCHTQKPACMMPSILFTLDITVTE